MNIHDNLLTMTPMTRSGQKLKSLRNIVIHFVDKPNTTALFNRNYFERLSRQGMTYRFLSLYSGS